MLTLTLTVAVLSFVAAVAAACGWTMVLHWANSLDYWDGETVSEEASEGTS